MWKRMFRTVREPHAWLYIAILGTGMLGALIGGLELLGRRAASALGL